MAATVDELTIQYEEDDVVVVKEIDKAVLSKGAWATVVFRYQELNRAKEEYGPDKYTIRRYKKSGGDYRQQSKFTISSPDQARKLIDVLESWMKE
jgi:histidinol-phosphate/aromatic aminotransferase/cobyric acid decarboxylase-like protein